MSSHVIKDLSFCVIDLETTGSLPNKDRIIDIGLIKVQNFEIVDEKNFLINPEMRIPRFIQKLTKIKQKDVESAPKIDDVINEVIDFIGDDILVAHNISFDIPFLNGVLKRLKMPALENKTLCTNIMTRNLIPEIISSNLTYMNKLFNLPEFKAHRALEDARMTAHLLVHYLRFFENRQLTKVNQLYYPAKKFELHKKIYNKDELPNLAEVVQEINSAYLLSFKASSGKVISIFPVLPSKMPHQLIHKLLQLDEVETVSLEIISNYFQGLLMAQRHFNRLTEDHRQDILKALTDSWNQDSNINYLDYDIIIAEHLIPGQIVAYSPKKANPLAQFSVFKYPNHSKKFFNQIRKMKSRKQKKQQRSVRELDAIINAYLSSNRDKYLLENYDRLIERQDSFWEEISKHLELQEKVPPNRYPLAYL